MKQYLKFNQETGDPMGLGPNKEGTCIEIEGTIATAIKDGFKQMNQFKVVLDDTTKKYVLVEIRSDANLTKNFVIETPASNFIFQLPTATTEQNGINLIQDISNGTWTATIQGDTINTLKELADNNKNLHQLFYVTANNNPNILHDTLSIDLNKLVDEGKHEIKTFDKQSAKLNISVYCRNLYNNYNHVRQNG
jgi:hypothetical protein